MVAMLGLTHLGAAGLTVALILGASPAAAQATATEQEQTAAAPVVLSPRAAALARALTAKEAEATDRFYAARGYEPLWLDSPLRLAALERAIAGADAHALPAARYDAAALALALANAGGLGDGEAAALELRVSATFLRYGRDIASGVLVPSRVDGEIMVRPPRPEPEALLTQMAEAADPGAFLAGLAPTHPEYGALVQRLAALRAGALAGAESDPIGAGPSLRLGDRDGRVPALRALLTATGDLEPADESAADADGTQVAAKETVTDLAPPDPDPRLFDAALSEAVIRFQSRHGLNGDGVVGPATRAALNTPAQERLRQIAVNLERLRWFNRDLGARHVIVNLAGFDMALVQDGAAIFTSRVVVGKARKHRTPEFSDEMEYMVINPTWHVPRSIAREEILPELQRDPTYLARKNMRLEGTDLDPTLIDWTFVTPATFPGRIKQAPGSGNALGRVKFMFPNNNSIYLHDTPSRSLFARDSRAFSHGCVRVQKPLEFAYHLLTPQVEDPRAHFDAMLNRGREVYLHLDEHVPVHLTYRTAWVDAQGRDQFRADIYGRDRRVAAALEEAGVRLLP